MEENKMTSKQYHEPWIGGPETLLPFYVEAALAWILAFGLLSVSGYHYAMETLVKPYWTRIIQTYCYTMTTSTNNNNFSHHFTLFCQSWLWYPLSYFLYGPTPSTIRNLRHSRTAVSSKSSSLSSSSSSSSLSTLPCWLPLTTCSRSEMDRASPRERLQQFAILLQKIGTREEVVVTQQQPGEKLTLWNDQQLITIMRGNVTLRRLASLAMRPVSVRNHGNKYATTTTNNNNTASRQIEVATLSTSLSALRQQLVRIWPALLRLPPAEAEDDDGDSCGYRFEISLIIACFRERPSHVRLKLHHALNMARCPEKIQVVLVDAGGNTDNTSSSSSSGDCGLQQVANEETMRCNSSSSPSLQHVTDRTTTSSNGNHSHFSTTTAATTTSTQQPQQKHCWGSIKIVNFCERQQGRGPALNAGAAHSIGRILAFLHSDTKLPVDWDMKLHDTFRCHRYDNNKKENHVCNSNSDNTSDGDGGGVRANAAAFGFGIDMNGLSKNTNRCQRQATTTTTPLATVAGDDDLPSSQHDSSTSYYPPGLRAIQITANLRCQLWSLPYGDQCLCLPKSIFDHVGGYPHQCFMEDYELIALMRRRQALMHKFFGKTSGEIIQRSSTMEFTKTTATTTTVPTLEQEALQIIPGPCVLCSPRRWQRLGVLYVTYMNSKLVNLYHAHGLTPQDLYERYYGHSLRDWYDLAPWEIQLYSEVYDDDKQQQQGQQ